MGAARLPTCSANTTPPPHTVVLLTPLAAKGLQKLLLGVSRHCVDRLLLLQTAGPAAAAAAAADGGVAAAGRGAA